MSPQISWGIRRSSPVAGNVGRELLLLCFLALALLAAPGLLVAQESQVAIDAEGRIEVVDAQLARRLGLFVDEYPGFVEARLFQASDATFALEVLVRRDGRVVRERRVLTAEEARDLRERVSTRARDRAPGVGLNQEGRDLLLGQTSLLGLVFYGPAMVEMTGADGTAALGTYLLTAGASFFAPFALTQSQPVTYGMANLSRYGATRGALHGSLLYTAVAGDREGSSEGTRAALAMGASVAEGVLGYRWARADGMTPGTAAAIGLGGDLGLGFGAGTAVVLDGRERLASVLALGGSLFGVYGASRVVPARDYTWGDVSLMYTSGILGAYTAATVLNLTGTDHERAYALAAMAGAAAGVWQGDRLVSRRNLTVGQGTLVQLGTVAGGGIGLGVAAMTGSEDEDVYLTATALGALLGFGATYALQSSDVTRRDARDVALRLRVTPAALLVGGRGEESGGRMPTIPLATVEYRF